MWLQKTLNGYTFPVYTTDHCPRNETEFDKRSSAINCTRSYGYACFPNDNLTLLLEFCHPNVSISIQKGESKVQIVNFVCLFVCLFVCSGIYDPLENFLLLWTLPVRGFKFWPMLGTNCHWAVMVLKRAKRSVTWVIRSQWSSPKTRDTHTCCKAIDSGAVTNCFYD